VINQRQNILIQLSGNVLHFLQVVPGGRNEDTKEHLPVTLWQVFGFGHKADGKSDRHGCQQNDDCDAGSYPSAHPINKTSDSAYDTASETVQGHATRLVCFRLGYTAQNLGRESRYAGNGNNQAQKNCAADSDCNIPEQLTCFLRHEDNGQENRYGRQGTGKDGSPNFNGSVIGCLHTRFSHFPVTKNILEHHNGIVHHHTNGKAESR